MPDYKAMYFQMAAKVADAVELLIQAQQNGENAYTEEPRKLTALPKAFPSQKKKP